jgi:hypothetical protein
LLLGSLIASFALGALVAYIALEALPCHWFGTAFEGACAYGVLYTSIGIGLAVAVLAFSYLCYRVLRRSGRTR